MKCWARSSCSSGSMAAGRSVVPAIRSWRCSRARSRRCAAPPSCSGIWPSSASRRRRLGRWSCGWPSTSATSIEDEGNVYGDGVNTAARLQGLAGAGGLVVSRSAYEHLRGKIDLRFEHMGAHKLHNLAARVHAYRADIGTGSKPRLAALAPQLRRRSRRAARRRLGRWRVSGLSAASRPRSSGPCRRWPLRRPQRPRSR